MTHFVIAPILLPAIFAAIILVFARNQLTTQRALTGLAVILLIGLSTYAVTRSEAGPTPYHLGNWPAPFGILLVLDRLSALMLMLTAIVSLAVFLHVIATDQDKKGRHFHALFLFQLMGINGAFLTADLFNLFVFFEVLLIASYGLMVHGGGAARLHAGMQYVAFNLLGSAVFLIALAILYNVAGTLNMADLAQKLPLLPHTDHGMIRISAALLLMVFAVKGALVPLQFWLPATYSATSGPVAALFAIMTKVGAYAALRVGTLVYPPQLAATSDLFADLLWPAAIATILLGSLGALGTRKMPMMIAFAGIGSMGVIFSAISDFTPASTTAALYYMLHSTLATAALFLLSDLLTSRGKSNVMAALFMVLAIAMIGLPPLSGFVGKVLVLDAVRDPGSWAAVLAGSFVTMLAFSRMGTAMFWETASETVTIPLAKLLPIGVILAAILCLTIGAGNVTDWLGATANDLHNPADYIAVQSLAER